MRCAIALAVVALSCRHGAARGDRGGDPGQKFAADYLECEGGYVFMRPLEQGWLAECHDARAICDTYGGEWQCSRLDPPEVIAGRAVRDRSGGCESIHRVSMTDVSQFEVSVRLEACGAIVDCIVPLQHEPSCTVVKKAPDEVDPPPAAACAPPCRPGFACVEGKCVSACNPPCEKGQRCTEKGDCVSSK